MLFSIPYAFLNRNLISISVALIVSSHIIWLVFLVIFWTQLPPSLDTLDAEELTPWNLWRGLSCCFRPTSRNWSHCTPSESTACSSDTQNSFVFVSQFSRFFSIFVVKFVLNSRQLQLVEFIFKIVILDAQMDLWLFVTQLWQPRCNCVIERQQISYANETGVGNHEAVGDRKIELKITRCSHQSRPIRCPLAPAIQDLAAFEAMNMKHATPSQRVAEWHPNRCAT